MVDRCLRQTRWLSNLVRILQPLRVNHADPYLSVPCSIDSVFFTCIKTISYFIYPISYSCDKNKNIEPYPSTTDDPASLWKQEYLGHVWTCFVCVTPPKTNMSLTQRGRFTRKVVFQPLRFSRDTSVFVFFPMLSPTTLPGISGNIPSRHQLELMIFLTSPPELRKQPSYFPLYWMVNRNPYYFMVYEIIPIYLGSLSSLIPPNQPGALLFSLLTCGEVVDINDSFQRGTEGVQGAPADPTSSARLKLPQGHFAAPMTQGNQTITLSGSSTTTSDNMFQKKKKTATGKIKHVPLETK